jgi:hypothetical protein
MCYHNNIETSWTSEGGTNHVPDKGDLFIESPTSSTFVSEIFCVVKRHNIVRDNLSIK